MAWASQTKTLSLFSSSQSSSAPPNPFKVPPPNHPYGQMVRSEVFYMIQDLDFSNVAYVNAILNPCSNPNLDLSKRFSALLVVNVDTVSAQRWLIHVFSKALNYHLFHESLLFVDHINYTLMSWYNSLKHLYKQYLASFKSKSTSMMTPKSWWDWLIRYYCGELLDLLSTWLIYAIEEGYSHGNLLNCIYFLDLSSPKLMISDGFDKNCKIDRTTNPHFHQVDLNAFRHVVFVIANQRPVADLLKVNGYKYSSFRKDVPSYVKSFHASLSNFPPVPCINRIILKPSFIRPIDSRIKYFYNLLYYFYERPHQQTAFNNLKWSWRNVVKNDKGLVGQFYKCSTNRTGYKDNSDVLRFFRNADQHMIEELNLGLTGVEQEEILFEFDNLLDFSKMIDEKVHDFATTYNFNSVADKEAFLIVAGF